MLLSIGMESDRYLHNPSQNFIQFLMCLFFKKHITTFDEYLIPLMNNSVKKKRHSMNTCNVWFWFQVGKPWFDGVEGVTQCPILPGEIFTYQFVVDRVKKIILANYFSILLYFCMLILCYVFVLLIWSVAWDIHVSFTLRNAERIWINRNDSSFSS